MLLRATKMSKLKKKKMWNKKGMLYCETILWCIWSWLYNITCFGEWCLPCFFLTTCIKMHRQDVLCIWMSHNHYIKCGDCLLEITELSAISEWQCISRPLRWVWVSYTSIFFTCTISGFYRDGKWMDHFHSHCLWPLLHWNYPPIFSCSFLCLPLKTTGRSPSHALPDIG